MDALEGPAFGYPAVRSTKTSAGPPSRVGPAR